MNYMHNNLITNIKKKENLRGIIYISEPLLSGNTFSEGMRIFCRLVEEACKKMQSSIQKGRKHDYFPNNLWYGELT